MFNCQLLPSFTTRREARTQPVHKPPVCPLPIVNDQPPVLLVFDHTDLSVELAYEKHYSPDGPRVRSATRETTLYWVPRLTPVFVVSDGTVVYAHKHKHKHGDCNTIVVDHGNDWLTLYSGIRHMFVPDTANKPRREVKLVTGDMLGYLGASHAGPLQPLHFELWRCNRLDDYEQIDPIRYMRRWRQLGWQDAQLARAHGPPPRAA